MAESTTNTTAPESYNYLSYVLAMYEKDDEGKFVDPSLWEGKYPDGVLPF